MKVNDHSPAFLFRKIEQTSEASANQIGDVGLVVNDFNLHNKPILVVSFTGKIDAFNFNFEHIENDNLERRCRLFSGDEKGCQNFSGSVIFPSCNDKLFGTDLSPRNNHNIKAYIADLSERLNTCTDKYEIEELQEMIDVGNQHISSMKLSKLSFGCIINPELIDIQNSFPSMHNTINHSHREVHDISNKAYTKGITENVLFRDKHFKIGSEGEFLKRERGQDDLDAVKKHIEKGRLADQAHINSSITYNPNLSEILFLPKNNYNSSALAMYVDFSSGFEKCSKSDINRYLFENSNALLELSGRANGKPMCVIFNNEYGYREMAELSIKDGSVALAQTSQLI
ncbi:hypothetical protein [Yersinia aldovae]|uniref:hypothetical protein n=1 Tax=Yersinia aldovae TaxID=29483 RepID=UPI0011A0A707|nr:hypothetical protein [Yersinia aldovae]